MEEQYPAVVMISRGPTKRCQDAFVTLDGKTLSDGEEADRRLGFLVGLEWLGGCRYDYQVVPLTEAQQAAAALRAELEERHGLSKPAEPVPVDYLGQAADLARQRWAGDGAMLARVDRAVELARGGAVRDLGGGQYEVTGQSGQTYAVNGACQCGDYAHRQPWCKHRIAVALTKRAAELAKNGAESAANTSAPESVPEGTNTQEKDTTETLQAQAAALLDRPDLFMVGGSGPWTREMADLMLTNGARETIEDLELSRVIRDELEARRWPAYAGAWHKPGAVFAGPIGPLDFDD